MNEVRFLLKLTLYKKGDMIYYSQLDMFHLLEKALRRADLPLYFTKGFSPHVKISFPFALRLGIEGKIEAILYFTEEVSLSKIKEALWPELPQGLENLNIEKI